jgi:tetratricopeptide (TPR) repeat protein
LFFGRDDLLSQLHDGFWAATSTYRGRIQVLSGLGGVGKTQVAFEYAHRHQREYKHVLSVNADTQESLDSGLDRIAKALGLKQSGTETSGAEEALTWLRRNGDWLLIADNADNPLLLAQCIQSLQGGHVLVTSRANAFDILGVAQPLVVRPLGIDEATQFLLFRTGRRSQPLEEAIAARDIASELDGLPLALEQAAAYIVSKQVSFAHYLTAFLAQRLKLIERAKPLTGEYHFTVATTWTLNLISIAEISPAAADVIHLSAILYPDDVPFELFVLGRSSLGARIELALANVDDDPTVVDELLEPLVRYSLIYKDAARYQFSVHRLVQEVIRNELGDRRLRVKRRRLMQAMAIVFPPAALETWFRCARMLRHAISLVSSATDSDLNCAAAGTVLHRAAHYLEEQGHYLLSLSVYQKAVEIRQAVLGEHDAELGSSVNNLGLAYHRLGKYGMAEPLLRRALSIRENALGPSHPDVAQTLSNLAIVEKELGRLPDAANDLERARQILEAAGEKFEVDLAFVLNNMAAQEHQLGNGKMAEELVLKVLSIRERHLGPAHPQVAASVRDLAVLTGARKDFKAAGSLIQRALRIEASTTGEWHPSYAATLNLLGANFLELGELDKAEAAFRQAINIYDNRNGGMNSPGSFPVLINLCDVFARRGENDKAIACLIDTVAWCESALGYDHIDVGTALNNLGYHFTCGGYQDDARESYRRCVAIRKKVLGDSHPDVAVVIGNLAVLAALNKEYDEARELFAEADLILQRSGIPVEDAEYQLFLRHYLRFIDSTETGIDRSLIADRLVGMKRDPG